MENTPAPEVLKPQVDAAPETPQTPAAPASDTPAAKPGKRPHHSTYRPSHKATFISLIVVAVVLLINVGIVAFVLRGQSEDDSKKNDVQLSVSQEVLDKLGVNRSSVGDSGIELTVNPDTKFGGKVEVGGDVSIAGGLKLNSEFTAAGANLSQLQAGETSLEQLNVNGDGTLSNLVLRNDLTVNGTTRLQGSVIISQLLTVNNSLNVIGNLAVGGSLAVKSLQVNTLKISGDLAFGGHLISSGARPGVSAGGGVGSNGTVSISGSDAAGTVAVNAGVGAGSGTLASVSFRTKYSNTPRVLVTVVGAPAGNVYVTRNSSGFTIAVGGSLSPGGYAFDYLVVQ